MTIWILEGYDVDVEIFDSRYSAVEYISREYSKNIWFPFDSIQSWTLVGHKFEVTESDVSIDASDLYSPEQKLAQEQQLAEEERNYREHPERYFSTRSGSRPSITSATIL